MDRLTRNETDWIIDPRNNKGFLINILNSN